MLHRWVLHGQYLYRSPLTAAVWKRIHFDHHQDPHDLGVLFGALYTTLPTIALITLPLGYSIGGLAGSMAALAAALLTTCFYEFVHSAQHLNFRPKSKMMQEMKRLHLLHHFHSEKGNHGITNFIADRLLGTYYVKARDLPKSATVFNLGYDEIAAERYPWVAQLSGSIRTGGDGRRWRPGQPIVGAEAVGADLGYGESAPRGQAA
jgi:sterol desaturase/sphingolipid hydroxylase (fatty acid hydroxylase superfamily)